MIIIIHMNSSIISSFPFTSSSFSSISSPQYSSFSSSYSIPFPSFSFLLSSSSVSFPQSFLFLFLLLFLLLHPISFSSYLSDRSSISTISFIHSGYFYSTSSSPRLLGSAPDTAQILCRSFTPRRRRQLRV